MREVQRRRKKRKKYNDKSFALRNKTGLKENHVWTRLKKKTIIAKDISDDKIN